MDRAGSRSREFADDPEGLWASPRDATAWNRAVCAARGGGSHYDLVYAAGLFDYLPQRTAQRLVEAMFRLLRPGGELLVTNFVPEVPDVGYMECVMDWHLIYRTPEDMLNLAALIPEAQRERLSLLSEADRNLIFLHLTRGS